MSFLHMWACVDAQDFEIRLDKDGNGEETYEILQKTSPTSPKSDSHHASASIQSSTLMRGQTPLTEQIKPLYLNLLNERSGIRFSSSQPGILSDASFGTESQSEESDGDEYPTTNTSPEATCDSVLNFQHPFQSIRQGLVDLASKEIHNWISTARYIAPPDHRLPSPKRARATSWSRVSAYVEEDVPEDSEAIILSRIQGYYHLACPYYASNPTKYLCCLQHYDLQSIGDVIAHLHRVHTEPPYCPRCRQTFTAAIDRDRHFYAMKCELRRCVEIEGITSQQKSQLVDQDDPRLGERARWKLVWSTIFPGEKQHRSLYLEKTPETAISMTRDYWASHGMDLISQFLENHDVSFGDGRKETKAMVSFHSLILGDLLLMVLREHSLT